MSRPRFAGVLVLALLGCAKIAAREPDRDTSNVQRGDRASERTLVAGTLIVATIDGGIPLTAIVSADVTNARRWVVIPVGSRVGLRVGRGVRGTLEVTSVAVSGRVYPVSSMVGLTAVTALVPGTRILFVLPEGLTVARATRENL